MVQDLFALLQPVVTGVGLELVDVELKAGVLQVTVDRDGGVDLEALTDANRAVSTLLDEIDPIPGRYSLEVSSPGIERPLRTPAQFAKAVGSTVSVKTRPQVPGERRLTRHPGRRRCGRIRTRCRRVRGRPRAARVPRHRPGPHGVRLGRPGCAGRQGARSGPRSGKAERKPVVPETPAQDPSGRQKTGQKTQKTQKRKQVVTP